MASAVRSPDTSPLGAIEMRMTSPPPDCSASCNAISTEQASAPLPSEPSMISLPDRSSVWSASSLPGTVWSGICLTHTAMFMGEDSCLPTAVRAKRTTPPPLPSRDGHQRHAPTGRRRAGRRGGPGRCGRGARGEPARPHHARRRQGALPPGQDVRRRPHHRGPAPARRPRARRPQAPVVRLRARDRDRRARRA